MKDYSINISVEKKSNISNETAETVNFHFSHYKSKQPEFLSDRSKKHNLCRSLVLSMYAKV